MIMGQVGILFLRLASGQERTLGYVRQLRINVETVSARSGLDTYERYMKTGRIFIDGETVLKIDGELSAAKPKRATRRVKIARKRRKR